MADKPIDELTIQVTTTIEQATKGIDDLITRLDSLNSSIKHVRNSLNGVNTSFSKVSTAVNKVNSGGIGKLNDSIEKTSSSVSSLAKNFGSWVLGLFTANISLKTISNHISKCLDLSTDYTEVINKLTVAMDNGSDSMDKYSDKAIEFAESVQGALGVDMVEWLDYQGTFASLFKGFKVQEDHMAIMSRQLTQLAYDYSSLYNKPVSEAFNKINSALSGQIKGLKDYGNNVSVAMVQQTALTYGITEQISKLDTATQAYLRYITIMNNAKYTGVFTDMNRTIESTANQMRVLESLITQFRRSLGDVYNIAATLILPVFIRIVGVITIMVKKFKEFLITTFGLTDIIDFGAGISSVSTGADEATESIKGATKAAKEYKKSLQGFDELNIIKSQDSSGAGTDTGGSGVGYSFSADDLPQYDFLDGYTSSLSKDFEALYDKIMPVITALGKLAIFASVATWVSSALPFISKFVYEFQFLGLCISTFIGEIIAGNGIIGGIGAVFGETTATVVATVASFVPAIATVTAVIASLIGAFIQLWNTNDEWKTKVIKAWENIKKVFKSVYDNVLKPVFDGIVTAFKYSWEWGIKPLWDKWVEFVGTVSGVMLDLWNVLAPIFSKLLEWLKPVLGGAFEFLGALVAGIVAGICGVFNTLLTVATGVFSGIGKLINVVVDFVNGVIDFFAYLYDVLVGHSIIPDLVNAIIGWFGEMVSNVVNAVSSFVGNIINWFVSLYTNIVNKVIAIKDTVVGKAREIWNSITTLFSGFSDFFTNVTEPIKSIFSKVWEAVKTSATKAWNKILELFSSGGKIFSGIKDGIASIFKTVVNSLITGINKLIKVPFDTINGLLNTVRKTEVLGIKPFQKLWSNNPLPVPQIPKLADGGAPNKGQLFYANERGTELVSHIGGQSVVANNQDMLDLARDTMVDTFLKLAMKGNSTQPVHITVNTQLDKKTIAKSTVEYVNGQIRQTGVNPIKG